MMGMEYGAGGGGELEKLPPSEDKLAELLQTLWDTRKTGLTPSQKSHLQSLLGLSSSHQLHLVLACLRSIIRKCVRGSLDRDDIQKLFPADLSMDLRALLVFLLQKHQNQWKEEASNNHDQTLWQRIKASCQQKGSTLPALTGFAASELSSSTWPRVEEFQRGFICIDRGAPLSISDLNSPCMAPMSMQQVDGLSNNLVKLPCLKSITWTMENHMSASVRRVAVINLKLHDHAKSPSGEIEVKFQLSRDTIDAILRSMDQISEQLSKAVSGDTNQC